MSLQGDIEVMNGLFLGKYIYERVRECVRSEKNSFKNEKCR